jgi:hypothetical protein
VPKSDIAVVDADENGLKLNEDAITDKGESLKISYEAKFDGKDYPVTGDPSSDSVSYQRVTANTLKGTLKKGGKVTTDATVVVSKDGKITTVNYTDLRKRRPQMVHLCTTSNEGYEVTVSETVCHLKVTPA